MKDSLWFQVLDRWGLPTMFAVVLLWTTLQGTSADRRERRELLTRLADAVAAQVRASDAQTAALARLAAEQRAVADAIRVTWPRLKLPPPPRPELARSPAPPPVEAEP